MTSTALRAACRSSVGVVGSLLAAAGASAGSDNGLSLAQVAGIWQSRGYGNILDIGSAEVVTYHITDAGCVRVEAQPHAEFQKDNDRIAVSDGRLSMFLEGGLTRYVFERRDALPGRCESLTEQPVRDPVLNFSALWLTLRENYAFFALKNVDWAATYGQFRPKIGPDTDDRQLFEIFSGMLAQFQDGHVSLRAGEHRFGGGSAGELAELWMRSRQTTDWEAAREDYNATVGRFVDRQVLKGKVRRDDLGILSWGWIAPGIGYLNVAAMGATLDSAKDLTYTEQQDRVAHAMKRMLHDLGSARALVVDLRFNNGGEDAIGLCIANHFAARRQLALRKQAMDLAGAAEAQDIFLEPAVHKPFAAPILVLQSGNTASAAEVLVMAMMTLPNVTRMGTPTYGAMSDSLGKMLPNRWKVSLSNEVYRSASGEVYEGRGIPADVPVDVAGIEDLHERLRVDIDSALAWLRERRLLPQNR